MIVSFCSVVHRLRRTSPVSNSTCRYALDISLSSRLCLSLSAYADCPVEMGSSSRKGADRCIFTTHRRINFGSPPRVLRQDIRSGASDMLPGGICTNAKGPHEAGQSIDIVLQFWLRGQDLNLRPSGYEPDELPGCSTPRHGVLPWQNAVLFGPVLPLARYRSISRF